MCYACLSDLLREVIISIGWESAGLDARSPFDPRISKFVGFIDVPTLRQFGVWNYAGSTIVSRTRPHRKGALVGEENTPSETVRVAQVKVVGFPPELYAGTTHTCVFEAPYGEGGDLLGCGAELLDGSGACVYRCAFAVFEDGVARSKPFEVKAPAEPGTYTWTVLLLDAQGKIRGGEGLRRREIGKTLRSFTALAHRTSVSAQGPADAVSPGRPFSVHVGVSCTADCDLSGCEVRVLDEGGSVVGGGVLLACDAPEHAGLSRATLELTAPATAGSFTWRVSLYALGKLALNHEGSEGVFTFATVR